MASIQRLAPAKLNLTLDVLGLRPDGYHDLAMVMQSVALGDQVTITTGGPEGIRVASNLPFLPTGPTNLAAAAAIRLCEYAGVDWNGTDIRLEKVVPVCAGLGGGSSDAAAVLLALNELLALHVPQERLLALAAQVGSDVPYCVMGGTALARGRGEVLTPLTPLPRCEAVLCKPPFPVSTPALFKRIDSVKVVRRPDLKGMLSALEQQDLGGVARRMYNVFEDVLPRQQQAEIAAIKNTLIQHGALGACMSGTGSAVFGLFAQTEKAEHAWEELRVRYPETFLTHTL